MNSHAREAYRRTRKDGATGVDEMTAKEYASKLDEQLASLLERFKSGTYWAPPVRRVHIPKGDGTTTRPMGIPTFEDKVLQRAVTMVMDAVYDQGFMDCSWGFRPGRSAHGALKTLREGLKKMKGGGYSTWTSSRSSTRSTTGSFGVFSIKGCATEYCVE